MKKYFNWLFLGFNVILFGVLVFNLFKEDNAKIAYKQDYKDYGRSEEGTFTIEKIEKDNKIIYKITNVSDESNYLDLDELEDSNYYLIEYSDNQKVWSTINFKKQPSSMLIESNQTLYFDIIQS